MTRKDMPRPTTATRIIRGRHGRETAECGPQRIGHLKLIAHAPHGFPVLPTGLETPSSFSRSPLMWMSTVQGIPKVVEAPHLIQRLIAGVYTWLGEEARWNRGSISLGACRFFPSTVSSKSHVNDQPVEDHFIFFLHAVAERRSTASIRQDLHFKRLGDIVICAALQAAYLYRWFRPFGDEHDDGAPDFPHGWFYTRPSHP